MLIKILIILSIRLTLIKFRDKIKNNYDKYFAVKISGAEPLKVPEYSEQKSDELLFT